MLLFVDLFIFFLFVLCPSFVLFSMFTTSNGTADNSDIGNIVVVHGERRQNSAIGGAVPSPCAAVPVVINSSSPVATAFCEAIVQTEQQQQQPKVTGTLNRAKATDQSEKLKLLFTLAKSGGVARMRAILSGCDANELKRLLAAEENGATLLDIAAQNDNTEEAKLLLEKGAIGPTDGTDAAVPIQRVTMMSKFSPFWAALLNEQTKLVEIMLENGQNPNEHGAFMRDEMEQTIAPLHFAAQKGNLELCKLLVAKGAKVNQRTKDKRGIMCLHIACGNGHLPIVRFLLESVGVDIERTDSNGDTALMCALLENNLDIGHYLIARGARTDRTNKFGISPLHYFVKKGDFALCKFLVDNGANVNQNTTDDSDFHFTPLHIACVGGHLQIVKLLVEEGKAHIESTDSNGDTALMGALVENNLDIGLYLISKGARSDHMNKIGMSPLHYFVNKGDFALCKFLVENGANINQNTTDDSDCHVTPLHIACAKGHLQIVKLLVEEGNADIEIADFEGGTALLLALLKRKFEIARYLCDKGARTDLPNNAGLTPHRLIGILGISLLLSTAAANANSD
ncbi:hypothetical protein niasHT_031749 [Heterodera trifolii]|uniref:ANK_REP_REGION domain-containing protein n=1 Tax=Heterodera trifolii TaxID=157864 RepID=A0ABD2IPD1_9BILA